jgi:hypothetical protein
MVSSARQKVDPQTRQLFDAEVDKPKHDEILTSLFKDDARLQALIMRTHQLKPLREPLESDEIGLWDGYHGGPLSRPARTLSFKEAVQLAGIAPTWSSLNPIREFHKRAESPLMMESSPRSIRLMGFIDIQLDYVIAGPMYLLQDRMGKVSWEAEYLRWRMLIEIKGEWPTAGNLLRQLNLYSSCVGGAGTKRLVVGPDASMNELVCAHGWRLATFDQNLKLNLVRPLEKARQPKLKPNEF